MGRPIIKADRDHDLYMEWSSIVEAPTFIGTRSEVLAHLGGTAEDEARLARADRLGSSSLRDPLSSYDGPLDGAWDDAGQIVEQVGWLPRERIYAWLMAGCPYEILEPFEDDDPDDFEARIARRARKGESK